MKEIFGPWVKAARCLDCDDGFKSKWSAWIEESDFDTEEEMLGQTLICRSCGSIFKWQKAVGRKIKTYKTSWIFLDKLVKSEWEWRHEAVLEGIN
jgi:hypothetical protein